MTITEEAMVDIAKTLDAIQKDLHILTQNQAKPFSTIAKPLDEIRKELHLLATGQAKPIRTINEKSYQVNQNKKYKKWR